MAGFAPDYPGFAQVRKDDKSGFINKKGIVEIPFIYDHAESFSNGLAKVFEYINEKASPWENEMKKLGYIDTKGTQYWED